MQETAFIFGSGAQGRVVLDILKVQYPAWKIYFVDENEKHWGTLINGAKVIGGISHMLSITKTPRILIALGNPFIRKEIADKLQKFKVEFLNAIHPSAVIMPSCTLGVGIMIGPGAVINTDSRIGNFVIINTNAVVEHDCLLEDFVCISPFAYIGGRVNIRNSTFISSCVQIKPRVDIDSNTIIGMGTLVTKNTPKLVMINGSPAKVHTTFKDFKEWQRYIEIFTM